MTSSEAIWNNASSWPRSRPLSTIQTPASKGTSPVTNVWTGTPETLLSAREKPETSLSASRLSTKSRASPTSAASRIMSLARGYASTSTMHVRATQDATRASSGTEDIAHSSTDAAAYAEHTHNATLLGLASLHNDSARAALTHMPPSMHKA